MSSFPEAHPANPAISRATGHTARDAAQSASAHMQEWLRGRRGLRDPAVKIEFYLVGQVPIAAVSVGSMPGYGTEPEYGLESIVLEAATMPDGYDRLAEAIDEWLDLHPHSRPRPIVKAGLRTGATWYHWAVILYALETAPASA